MHAQCVKRACRTDVTVHCYMHTVHIHPLTCACTSRRLPIVSEYERRVATRWLREARGKMSQADLAEDISRATGWTITRDRYSKYESGSLPFGKSVLQHFIDYWQPRGVEPPDFTPEPEPQPVEERAVDATRAIADAVRGQTEVFLGVLDGLNRRAEAAERRAEAAERRLDALETLMLRFAGDPTSTPGASARQGAVGWGLGERANMPSPRPEDDPVRPAGEG